MSHISVMRTKIKQVHEDILEETLRILFQMYPGLELTDLKEAEDLYVTVTGDIILRYRHRSGNRYIGLKFTENGLEFVYDDFMWHDIVHDIMNDFQKTYVAVAIAKVAQKNGYEIQHFDKMENGAVYAELVRR